MTVSPGFADTCHEADSSVCVMMQGRLYSCQDLNGNFLHSEYVLPQGQYITREWCEDAAAQVTTPAYHSVVNVTLPAYTPQRR
jgi:hypothetical protein